jgi:hypothetical protein
MANWLLGNSCEDDEAPSHRSSVTCSPATSSPATTRAVRWKRRRGDLEHNLVLELRRRRPGIDSWIVFRNNTVVTTESGLSCGNPSLAPQAFDPAGNIYHTAIGGQIGAKAAGRSSPETTSGRSPGRGPTSLPGSSTTLEGRSGAGVRQERV